MKKTFILLVFLAMAVAGFSSEWIGISSTSPVKAGVTVVSPDINHSTVHFTLAGFNLNEVQTPRGAASFVTVGNSTPLQEAGAPDLPKLTSTLVIPDMGSMSASVISATYKDYENIVIAPSKGILTRDVDPATVPYTYGAQYSTNAFYPAEDFTLQDPFIMRDLRGQTIWFNPFRYNPVTRTLRVYYDVTVSLASVPGQGINELYRKTRGPQVSGEWQAIYKRGFDNFNAVDYTPVEEYGNMLVLCYNSFMTAMQPYVDWKNQSGYPTVMVDVAQAGTTAADIKTYITNYYNTNGLAFVLLVGDNAQIPTNTGGGLGGPSDNAYGYILGNDHYSDIYIGRFSAETVAQVETQVQRTLEYEQDPQFLTDDWLTSVIGIASDQGPGDDNEYDYQHIRGLQAECLAYTYTWNPELFDGSQGGNDASGNPSPSQVSTAVNEGAGLILYTGHGSQTSWGTSGFNNSNVNALTNQDKLPFIWSVACVNGDFQYATCFAEAWLRASQNGEPTGAMAFLGSTINQSWNSPMEGEDEMVAVLTENIPGNIKRTFGGTSISGCMRMIDAYGTDGSNMADTWTIFGDPTLLLRTAVPGTMTVSHDPTLFVGSTSFTVNCNVNGARATLSIDGTILTTGLISNGSVILNFPALSDPQDTVRLVITAYNYVPYITDLNIITPNGPYVMYYSNAVNDATGNNDQMIDYGEDILLTVGVKNLGVEATAALNVKVTTADPYIMQSDSTEYYGVVQPGATASVPDAYSFHVSGNIPDDHSISFDMVSVDGSNSWNSSFSITAHAPALSLMSYMVLDPLGNNNGRLDPGENAQIKVFIENNGSAEAFNVMGNLVSISPWITVQGSAKNYGDLAFGQNSFETYDVAVGSDAPEGQTAPFMLEISADRGIATVGTFNLIIGRLPLVIVDYDGNTNSGTLIKSAAENLGLLTGYYETMPDNLADYASVFVCLGVYPDNHVLSTADGQKMKDYLEAGGRAYMEGGDTWKHDPPTPVHSLFHILGFSDGSNDLGTIDGFSNTFTNGMSFNYSGDNKYIDRITNEGAAWPVFKNVSPVYNNAVAYEDVAFKTIGSSFEYGGLDDAAYPSTKQHLLEEYLDFFGIAIPTLAANFAGYPTSVQPGGNVNFTDFSTGGVTSWSWTFPGGSPAASTEQNPVVFYNEVGDYNVRLIVDNGISKDTLVKEAYIHVDDAVAVDTKSTTTACSIVPNPSNGSFLLNIASPADGNVNLRIFNTLGSMVYSGQGQVANGTLSKRMNLTGLPNGIYFLNIQGDSGTVTKRLVISR